MRGVKLLCFFLQFLFTLPTLAQQIQISSDFDSGSLGGWETNNSNEVFLKHSEQSGGLWYHFQIDQVQGKTITFVFESVRSDYFGGSNLPALSYDQVHWKFIKNRTIEMNPKDPTRVRFSFTHTFSQNQAWIAYTPPYSNPFLDNWLKTIQPHPHVTIQNICETPIRDLPLPAVFITDPTAAISDKRVILLLAREDAYETSGSWFVQGVGDFLLSEDPVAMELRKRTLFILIPIFDRDGVALGNAIHPLPAIGRSIFWTETWTEAQYSFFEQRQLKRFLQDWKNQGYHIHGSLRIHSSAWQANTLRPEFVTGASQASQSFIFTEILSKVLPGICCRSPNC